MRELHAFWKHTDICKNCTRFVRVFSDSRNVQNSVARIIYLGPLPSGHSDGGRCGIYCNRWTGWCLYHLPGSQAASKMDAESKIDSVRSWAGCRQPPSQETWRTHRSASSSTWSSMTLLHCNTHFVTTYFGRVLLIMDTILQRPGGTPGMTASFTHLLPCLTVRSTRDLEKLMQQFHFQGRTGGQGLRHSWPLHGFRQDAAVLRLAQMKISIFCPRTLQAERDFFGYNPSKQGIIPTYLDNISIYRWYIVDLQQGHCSC